MNESRGRITGTEMEWPVQIRLSDTGYFQPSDETMRSMLLYCRDKRLLMDPCSNLLSNGGRYYVDVGDHPEYATPEDDSIIGSVANEMAGETIMRDTLETAKRRAVITDYILSKRVVDDAFHTWGYHISLGSELLNINEHDLAPLGMHLATINIFAGAGAVVPVKSGGSRFVLAQKALNLNTDWHGMSHLEHQPLISLRKESLSADLRLSRVHVTSLDANMSPWATWMKIGTTSIVLRLLENGYMTDFPASRGTMHRIARSVADDAQLETTYPMDDGSEMTALELQRAILLLAQKYRKNEGLIDEEDYILHEWERVLADLEQDPELTIDRVEWVGRRRVLTRYMGRYGLDLSDSLVREKDRQWSYMSDDLGIALRLRQSLWKQWMPPAEQIERAYLLPPTTTRAFARGGLIRRFAQSLDATMSAQWNSVTVANGQGQRVYQMNDPYNPRPEKTVYYSPDHDFDDEIYDFALED